MSNIHNWTYEGPQTWSEEFDGARGNHQSPINIDTKKAVFNPLLKKHPLRILYDHDSCIQIKNTGHTFQIDSDPNNNSKVDLSPVHGTFRFLQFHMHWGDNLERGSEHLVDHHAFAAELHFVNWNSDLYSDPKTATESKSNDGLLVLGVFVKIGKHNNEFEKLVAHMKEIHLKDHHVPVENINLKYLLPSDTLHYWTYPGSLTTPPCNECVLWIVFKNPIEVSEEQMNKCHELYNVTKERLCNKMTLIRYNDRPVCSLNDRVVQKSFEHH